MKDKISWLSVRSLVRLEMRARFGSRVDMTAKAKASKALSIIFTLAIYAVLVTGIYYLAEMFVRRSHMPFEFLVVAMTFTVCVTTIVAIGNVVKNLYLSGDNELLLRFPVNGREILISKSIYCFLHNVVINLLIMIPVCVIYGVVSSAPVGYYFVAIAVTLLAIPLQFLLVLILLIAAICGVFILYMTALSGVLEYMRDESESMFSPAVMDIFRNFANSAYPFRWYALLLGGWFSGYGSQAAGLSFLYLFLITAALCVGAYFVTSRTYYQIILNGIETEISNFRSHQMAALKTWVENFVSTFESGRPRLLRRLRFSFGFFYSPVTLLRLDCFARATELAAYRSLVSELWQNLEEADARFVASCEAHWRSVRPRMLAGIDYELGDFPEKDLSTELLRVRSNLVRSLYRPFSDYRLQQKLRVHFKSCAAWMMNALRLICLAVLVAGLFGYFGQTAVATACLCFAALVWGAATLGHWLALRRICRSSALQIHSR